MKSTRRHNQQRPPATDDTVQQQPYRIINGGGSFQRSTEPPPPPQPPHKTRTVAETAESGRESGKTRASRVEGGCANEKEDRAREKRARQRRASTARKVPPQAQTLTSARRAVGTRDRRTFKTLLSARPSPLPTVTIVRPRVLDDDDAIT